MMDLNCCWALSCLWCAKETKQVFKINCSSAPHYTVMYTFSDALLQFCFIILLSWVGEKRIKTDRVSAVLKLKHVILTLYKQKRVTDHLAVFALTYPQCNWAMLLAVLLMVHPPQQALFLASQTIQGWGRFLLLHWFTSNILSTKWRGTEAGG